MSNKQEELLKELNELLPVEKKDLRTPEEKNVEIDRIIQIWCDLSEEYQNEKLLLSVLDRTKMNYKIYGEKAYFQKSIGNVNHVFNGTKKILKDENIYLNFINHIKDGFMINDIKELLDDEKRPFSFTGEEDYLKLTLIFYNNYFALSDFIEKYVPIQYRSAEFYHKIFEKQSEIGIPYGGNFKKFWELVPDNVKDKKLLLEICRRSNSHDLRDLLDIAPQSYFDNEFVSQLPEIIAKLNNKIPDVLNEALSKLPQNLLTQDFYSNMSNKLFENAKSDYDCQSIFEKVIPDKFKTKDMVLAFVKNFSNYSLSQILDSIPNNLKTKELYNDFFKIYGTNSESSGNGAYNSVSSVLKQIPKDYFTEQNLLNYIFQKQDNPEASGQLYKIIATFIDAELKDLYSNGLSKEFYRQLIENNPEDKLFTIFNSMPDEYKTEDMYLKSLEKNSDNPALELFFIFKLMQKFQENSEFPQLFSAEFFEKVISSSNEISHACSIYKSMPKKYQTEERYLNVVSTFKKHRNMDYLIAHWLPEELKNDNMYEKISNIVKTLETEDGKIIGNDPKLLSNFIFQLPTGFKQRENVINLFSSFEDENGDIINTPSNLLYLNRLYCNKEIVNAKLLEILSKEIENVENGFINENQFNQYESELNELLGLEMGIDSKTEIYGLNAIYLIQKYGYDISEEMLESKIFVTLKDIKDILENKDYENSQLHTEEKINFVNIDSILREEIKSTYQNKLYSVETREQDQSEKFDSEYNGKKVKVFQAKDDFNMIVHALGAYSGNKDINNYNDEWNIECFW